ncbi:MAG: aminotransferase class I/II-fold pyridoxal phosphate-dependent enzyme [Actinomycetaceae bacterium]|nr:aminotransferase class I/II-fold pyridoxal phosphate-dependent enzyme [Actinomycetaceae bacterium]
MQIPVAKRGQVEPFRAMEILKVGNQLAQAGTPVYSLCLGQPSTPAPQAVLEAAAAALRSHQIGYTDANGMPELRERISQHYRETYGAQVPADRIVITTGSSAAFTAIFLAAFENGDTVAMTRPGYPAYRNTLAALGCKVDQIDCGPQTRWQPSVEQLQARYRNQPAPKGLIIATPANPTGTVLPPSELAAIAKWCEENSVLLISDEIYHGISFGPKCASLTQYSDKHVAVGSFSKYYSMTGWRLGWAVVPEPLVRPVEILLGNLNLSAPTLSQLAAVTAFDTQATSELDSHVERYRENRQVVLSTLEAIGAKTIAPADGAFYCYADISHLTSDTVNWCAELLQSTGVALTPGVDFAPDSEAGDGLDPALDGSRYVRVSFAGATQQVQRGCELLTQYVKDNH